MSNLLHWLHLFQSDAKSLYPLPGFSQLKSFKYHETYFITSIPIYRLSHMYSHFLRITLVEPLFYARWSHSRNKKLYSHFIHVSFSGLSFYTRWSHSPRISSVTSSSLRRWLFLSIPRIFQLLMCASLDKIACFILETLEGKAVPIVVIPVLQFRILFISICSSWLKYRYL